MSLWILSLGALLLVEQCHCMFLSNNTFLENLLSRYQDDALHSRSRRAIPRSDKEEILQLHNKLRGQVHPSASNMEYMAGGRMAFISDSAERAVLQDFMRMKEVYVQEKMMKLKRRPTLT